MPDLPVVKRQPRQHGVTVGDAPKVHLVAPKGLELSALQLSGVYPIAFDRYIPELVDSYRLKGPPHIADPRQPRRTGGQRVDVDEKPAKQDQQHEEERGDGERDGGGWRHRRREKR